MSVYVNPFYARASEQIGDVSTFVHTFGAGAIDMLPDDVWDRLVILRSTRGAGKTSLMRMFTAESLDWVRKNRQQLPDSFAQLRNRGVLHENHVHRLGALVSLDRDYPSLLDLPIADPLKHRLFLRLLDVRVLVAVARSALVLTGRAYPKDIGLLRLAVGDLDPRTEAAVNRVGAHTGDDLLDYARQTEREILGLLDTLLVPTVATHIEGHSELYSLELLSHGIEVDGRRLDAQPLVMFDDGHKLANVQRETLLEQLRRRNPAVARWYAERFEALSDQELLSGLGESGRDHVLVELDDIARQGRRWFQRGRHDRVLEDIARRRAASVLLGYAQEQREFLDLLDDDRDASLGDRGGTILAELQRRTMEAAGDDPRYAAWLEGAEKRTGWDALVHWRELEVLVHRDQERQLGLFESTLTEENFDERSSPAIREGAAVSVAEEFGLPYYGGRRTIVRLASHNVEQFLHLCGDLLAEMFVDISLGRQPQLQLPRQHRVIREASERFWRSIPKTVPQGRDVQALVKEIVNIAKAERAKSTMPYPPGVTGTALLMGERAHLLDPAYRERTPGAPRLFTALASAVAHNVLSAQLDYSVKGNRYMVLYLNRLLCPRFWLPVGLGSFRERRLQHLIGWMQKLPSHGAVGDRQENRLPV